MVLRVLAWLFLFLAPTAEAFEAPVIEEKPISFDEERARLTLAYRQAHEDPEARSVEIDPRVIVLHHTASGSLEKTWRSFNRTTLAGRKYLKAAGALNVSAHFLVDRDGTIYRLLPETRFARHVIGLNHLAIGVENVGDGRRYPLTRAQLRANVALVRYLASRFRITHLIGHHEYRRMERHEYFRERDPRYRTVKRDPGARFMRLVRSRVRDLKLEGPSREKEGS
jgi:N-acetylmuramoyl-L-alanine amidase